MRRNKNTSLISNPKAYGEGYKQGIELALDSKKIRFKSVNPFKAIISPNYLKSHIAGIRDGYRQGLWKYEKRRLEKRLRELSRIQPLKVRGKDHGR